MVSLCDQNVAKHSKISTLIHAEYIMSRHIMTDHEMQKHVASLKSNLAQCILRVLDLRLKYSQQITANLRAGPALVTVFLVYCLCLSELCCIDSTICCCAAGRWAGWLIVTSKFILLHIKGTCCACRTILVPLNITIQLLATLSEQTTQINNNIAKKSIYKQYCYERVLKLASSFNEDPDEKYYFIFCIVKHINKIKYNNTKNITSIDELQSNRT